MIAKCDPGNPLRLAESPGSLFAARVTPVAIPFACTCRDGAMFPTAGR
jgi:hypothetical protein